MKKIKLHRGFSLLEILVVMGISLVIISVVLFGQGRTKKVVELNNAVYDILLYYREAQAYAAGSKSDPSMVSAPGYGVHVDINTPESVLLFADLDSDGKYDKTPQDEAYRTVELPKRIVVTRFCGLANGQNLCSGPSRNILDVSYHRPHLRAQIRTFPSVSDGYFTSATLYLGNGLTERSMTVTSTGQIATDEIQK